MNQVHFEIQMVYHDIQKQLNLQVFKAIIAQKVVSMSDVVGSLTVFLWVHLDVMFLFVDRKGVSTGFSSNCQQGPGILLVEFCREQFLFYFVR